MSSERWRPVVLVGLFWAGYVAILRLFGILRGMSPVEWRDLLWGTVSTAALLALTAWFVRRERGRLRSVGAGLERGSAGRFLAGIMCGLLLYGLIVLLVSLGAGPLSLARAPAGASLGASVLVVVSVVALSAMEEIGFRGFPLRTLAASLQEWPAQLIVAVAFGASHLLYGWPWQAVVLGVIPSGLLFGAAAAASGGLAFPIGVHAALNLAAWSISMKESPGLWTVTVPDGAAEKVSAMATWIGTVVTLAAAAAVARWGKRLRAKGPAVA